MWIILNSLELYWILLNYIELYWIILNYIELCVDESAELHTWAVHFAAVAPFPSISVNNTICVFKLPMIFPKWYGVFTLFIFPRMSGKKTLWLPIHMPRSLTLHCKETFDDPFRTSQTLAALAAEGADERSLQELARRFQRTLAADREAKSGAKWELTCKTWDWSNLIVRIDLSIYILCVCDVHITGKLTWCSWCNWDLNY